MPGVLSPEDATAGFRTPQANFGHFRLTQGTDADAIQRRVEALLADNPEVGVRIQADFLAQLASQVDTAVAIWCWSRSSTRQRQPATWSRSNTRRDPLGNRRTWCACTAWMRAW